MDDINSKINEILSNPQSMQQIQNIMSSLGTGNPSPENTTNQNAGAPAGTPDLSALGSILGSLGSNAAPTPPAPAPAPAANQQMPDISALSTMLAGMGGGNTAPQNNSQMPDLSSLSGMLGGLGNTAAPAVPAAGGFDPSTAQMIGNITKLAPLFQKVQAEDDTTRLLRALRPLLGPERQQRLDQSIKMLQLMRMMPLLKDAGLFSALM